MFFMIGLFPSRKMLKSMHLINPATGHLESAEIWQTGNQLVVFFIPVFTFSRQFLAVFSGGSVVCEIQGMDKDQILAASRMELQDHLHLLHAQPLQKICPHCGSILDDGFSYCPHCGQPTGGSSAGDHQ